MFSWWSSLGPQQREGGENNDEIASSTGQGNEDETVTDLDSEALKEHPRSELDYAKGVAKNVGDFLYNFASVATTTAYKMKDTVKDTVEKQNIPMIGDFNKEQEEFVKEKHKRKEAAVPPWVGYNEEEAMKNQILALSTDERNFLRDPPSGVPFHFESESMFPVALATLQEDKNLSKMRFQLVPKKISEERFWRNYFYRVSLIKQSTQLTSLAATGSKGSSSGSDCPMSGSETKRTGEPNQESKPVAQPQSTEEEFPDHIADSPVQHEFISDTFAHSEQELSHEDLQQIGVERKQAGEYTEAKPTEETNQTTQTDETQEDIPEWEKELQAELQDFEVVDGEESAEWEKEIEDMLGEEEEE